MDNKLKYAQISCYNHKRIHHLDVAANAQLELVIAFPRAFIIYLILQVPE